ncbi:hypothetical protein E2A64_15545 [Pseudohoeflea suaedae]|uniref:Cell envelope integrity protein TolA n=1 Tax=Pseudohoeflea suaedae TaxID=877384 RepID=A0A4R5PIQ1_9HYPH|nr:cell envelope integrity protein TolA [Pseudohoeflea suaedae]TDH35123.1 hypothetical protein E2A64_15545 [Pseudohoeflea suaedae]
MKGSLIISTGLHALLLGFVLSNFTAPRTLEVAEVEALPVDIVPVESITQIQQGDKKAELAEKSAPTPTERPDPVQDAENVGENKVDLANKAPKPAEREVVADAPPKPSEKPVPTPEPDPVPEPEPQPVEEAAPAPQPEPQPEPEPVAEPKPEAPKETEVAALPPEPDPLAEAIEKAPEEPAFEDLPTAGPVPSSRPKPETPKPTETAEKKPEKPAEKKQEKAAASSAKDSDFNADDIAALLNKDEARGGGAKRSTETASLGGEKTTRGETLSLSEMDALRGQIQKYWNIIPGMADGDDVRVTVKMRLDQSGNIIGNPDVSATGGSPGTRSTLAGSAKRAVLRAQPYQLPADKYASWSEVIVNFDPSQMF